MLEHFPNAALLGGDFKLNEGRARQALEQLTTEMSVAAGRKVTAVDAAQGVIDVVTANMERALRHISVERGYDPRDFTLVPFGGAGGLHAVSLARALRIPRVLLPLLPGALSAIGVVSADVVKDQSRTVMLEASRDIDQKLEKVFREMEREAHVALQSEGFADQSQRHERSLAVRYKGQSFELTIRQTSGNIARAFHRAHRARYGYAQEKNMVEIVSARVHSIGIVAALKMQRGKRPASVRFGEPLDFAETYFGQKKTRVAVYHREKLKPGSRLRTPCIVTEYSATTLIPKNAKAQLDAFGNIIIVV